MFMLWEVFIKELQWFDHGRGP